MLQIIGTLSCFFFSAPAAAFSSSAFSLLFAFFSRTFRLALFLVNNSNWKEKKRAKKELYYFNDNIALFSSPPEKVNNV